MDKNVIKSLFFLISLGTILCDKSDICDDWLSFKDEKCFTVITELRNYFEAQNACQQIGGSLAVIRSEEEQSLVNQYLINEKVANSVWIDLKRNNNAFEWSDGTDMKYTNWVKNRPHNSPDMECAVISVDLGKRFSTKSENFGKWLDVYCYKKTAILCQRIPPWSMTKIQEIVMENRRYYTDEIKILKTQIESHKNELNNLKSNPVPIGFIYIQLSGQSEPKTLWPNTEWQHISGNYAGLFFRTEGGQSSPFGQTQEQQLQSLELKSVHIKTYDPNTYTHGPLSTSREYNKLPVFTGAQSGGDFWGIQLKHNNEEVCPRNQAVRIWQRIK